MGVCLDAHGFFQAFNVELLMLPPCPSSALCNTHIYTHSLLHTCPLFSSQFDLLEWTTSHLWDDLLPVAAAPLRAVVGGWVGDVVPEDVAAVGCKCN